MKAKKSPAKKFLSLTPQQRDREVAKFDKEIDIDRDTKPLTTQQRAKWERARRGPVYSLRVYDGKKKAIKVQIEESLLKQFDKFAKRNDMSRDEFFERSLRSALAFAE